MTCSTEINGGCNSGRYTALDETIFQLVPCGIPKHVELTPQKLR